MADPVELIFSHDRIVASYEDGRADLVDDVGAAVALLNKLTRASLPVQIDATVEELARETASLAGMRIERRGNQFFLLHPDREPSALVSPLESPPPRAGSRVMIPLPFGQFNDSEAAFQHIMRYAGGKPIPSRFHNFATGTFLRGSTAKGRVTALFRSLLEYGPKAVQPKIQGWAQYVDQDSSDPLDHRFLILTRQRVDPRNIDALGDRSTVLPYFKFWTLRRIAAGETRSVERPN